MTVNVLPIEGPDSYWALQAYMKLLFGLKMLPMYMGEQFEEFLERVEAMELEDRKKILREAVLMVTLDREELMALVRFAADENGVPFTKENTKRLAGDQFLEIVQAVVEAIASIKINFLTKSEKKN